MASLNDIKSWFKTGKFPTELQFSMTWDSFWHKAEKISISAIENLEKILALKADRDIVDRQVDSLQKGKENVGVAKNLVDIHAQARDAHQELFDLKANDADVYHQDMIDGMFQGHTGNKDVHLQEGEREAWNAHKADQTIHKTSAQIRGEIVDADIPNTIARITEVTSKLANYLPLAGGVLSGEVRKGNSKFLHVDDFTVDKLYHFEDFRMFSKGIHIESTTDENYVNMGQGEYPDHIASLSVSDTYVSLILDDAVNGRKGIHCVDKITRIYSGENMLEIGNETETDDLHYNTYRVWTEGNDGTGSGLDADLLDGIQASAFLHYRGVSTNLDSVHDTGIWSYGSTTTVGKPTTNGVVMQFGSGSALTPGGANTWVNQLAAGTDSKLHFRQRVDSGNWTVWKRIAFSDEIPTIPSLSGGADTTSGQYVSGVTVSGHVVTVKKAALPTIPTALKNPNALTFTGAVTGTYDGSAAKTVNIPTAYSLPVASSSGLGGIKVGSNLSVDSSGVLSAVNTTYAVATTSANGLMSAAMVTKLNGIATGATAETAATIMSKINSQTEITFSKHVVCSAGAGTSSTSDIRFKNQLEELGNVLGYVLESPAFKYNWKEEQTRTIGTSAQYWEDRIPELVGHIDDEDRTRTFSYERYVVVLQEALKEEHEIREKEKEDFEKQVSELEDKLGKMQNLLEGCMSKLNIKL